MYPLVVNAFTRDRPGQAAGLLASLAASGRVFLIGPNPALLGDSGHLSLFSKDPKRAGGVLAQASLIRSDDYHPPAARACLEFAGEVIHSPQAQNVLPTIASSLRLPCVVRAGKRLIIPTAGYDAARRTHFAPSIGPSLELCPAPDPTYPHLHTLFSGLLYADPIFHANLLGTLCACFARPACESFPIILLDAQRQSSGKTAVARAFGVLLSGRDPSPTTYSGDESDMEARLGQLAGEPGPTFVYVDNIRAKRGAGHLIRSQFFAAAFASHAPCVRALYRGSVPVFEPVIVCTMNGSRVERDLADKVVRIALTLPAGTNQRGIYPFPPHYAVEHRQALLCEIMHLLGRVWLDLDTYRGTYRTRFYDFETIAISTAALLGFSANFDPAFVQPPDSLLLELAGMVADQDLFPDGVANLVDLVQKAEASQNVPELREFLRGVPQTSAKARGAVLRDCAGRDYAGSIITIAGRRGRLAVEGDTLRFVLDTAPGAG